jgi:tetratricopeptide (TPR) repeat protein
MHGETSSSCPEVQQREAERDMTGAGLRLMAIGWASALALAGSAGHLAGADAPAPAAEVKGPPLIEGLGKHHHAITTSSEQAQRYFDQGLVLVFGFNHAEAIRAFEEAARLDPKCAMCFWGVALALGPNMNLPMSPDDEPRAHGAAQIARRLAADASEPERAYIEALVTRYAAGATADRKPRDVAYAAAMRELSRRFSDDLDAATLFAESLLDLRPWSYWTKEGEPTGDTLELVSTLESVLARDPEHPGANHYYIHAVEASKQPERALASADRLPGLTPGAGHLVHMPAHIYMRVGRYDRASEINERAAAVDEEYFAWCHSGGFYPAAYYPHNLHFLAASASMEGRSQTAVAAARRLVKRAPSDLAEKYPTLEDYLSAPLLTLARFARWDEILAELRPAEKLRYTTGIWHYARGLALGAKGRRDEAARELAQLDAIRSEPGLASLVFAGGPSTELLGIASRVLAADLAARAEKLADAIRLLEEAVRGQDALPYAEPPGWYFPVRHALGAALLAAGRAAQAETVYREDLAQNPANGWALAGLSRSLREQKRTAEADAAAQRFEEAWARADVTLGGSML